MPIYVYTCKSCGAEFEELVMSSAAEAEVTCSACQSREITRKMSVFATTSGSGCDAGSSCANGSCPFAN